MSLGTTLGIAVLVLLGNAFFVGAEFALVSARRSNIELAALNGSRAAKMTLSGMEQVSLMLAGAQLGVTLCSLIFGAVGEPLVAHSLQGPFEALGIPEAWVHPAALAVALASMVYVHVVIGETVPKNLSLAATSRAALLLVPPLLFIVNILKPLVVSLNAIANACLHILGIKPRQEMRSSFSRDEVAGFVKESHREGLLSKEEESLLSGTLGFEERTVKHIVLPLVKVVTTPVGSTPADIERLATTTGYSRFPIRTKQGTFKGYIHVKDILQIPEEYGDQPIPSHLVRRLGEVKSNASLGDTLAIMQQTGSHIALVTGGKSKALGIVMLEDVLEELVGTIRDETQRNSRNDSTI